MLLGACSASLNNGGTGAGGATGIGGSGGSVPLPACTANEPTFGVCFVDAQDPGSSADTHTSGPATIEAVGSGDAPVSCRYQRGIGMRGPSTITDWWFQARTADNARWTIGVLGLGGSTPLVRQGDVVALQLDWSLPQPSFAAATAQVRLSDAAGTPLLWARARLTYGADADDPTWISFAAGDYVCGSADTFCDTRQGNVIATVNGNSMTLPPYGAASIGDYFVAATYFPIGICGDVRDAFEAAAAKISPVPTP